VSFQSESARCLDGLGRARFTYIENLAEMVGASRERVSRALAAFMAGGLITCARQAITIRDRVRLRDAAMGP